MPRSPATARKATAARAAGLAAVADSTAAIAEAAEADAAATGIADAVAAELDSAPVKPARLKKPAVSSTDGIALVDVPLGLIDESEHNPRRVLSELQPLMHSIRDHGVVEPLVVTPTPDGRYRIVAGHRRAAAAALAQLPSVPCIVRPAGDDDLAEMVARMVENLQRVDLDPVEEARGYARLKDLGMKQKAIAEAVGRNQGHVSKRLTLLSLPESLQARVGRPEDDGGITLEQAVEVGRLPGKLMIAVAEKTHADDDKRFSGGWHFDQAVSAVERDHRRATEVVEVVKALRGSKLSVLNVDGDAISPPPAYDRGDGPWPVFRLDVDDDAHAKLACHAVVLLSRPDGGGEDLLGRWTQAVCTDPASHAGDAPPVPVARRADDGGVVPVRDVDPEVTARNDALAAAVAAREAFAVDLCHGKVAAVMRDYVLRGQIRDAILGREYFLVGDDASHLVAAAEADDVSALLALGVTGSADRLVRAALACRLDVDLDAVTKAVREAALGRPDSWAPDVVDAVAFYEFAGKVGYVPAEVEVAALEAIAAVCPDPVRAALIEANLIDEAGDEVEPVDFDAARRAAGVTDAAIVRAHADGVPADVWLEPGRAIPTGRCSACSGPAKAMLSGPGRHAPGGGSVRKGGEACPGGHLLTIAEVEAADAAAVPVAEVTCATCSGLGKVGSADEADLSKLPGCPDCAGRGVVAPADAEAVAG